LNWNIPFRSVGVKGLMCDYSKILTVEFMCIYTCTINNLSFMICSHPMEGPVSVTFAVN